MRMSSTQGTQSECVLRRDIPLSLLREVKMGESSTRAYKDFDKGWIF